jgi:organic hydroperoxide reductase OsmC/OhrA
MEPFPHRYQVKGCGRATGHVELSAEGLTTLRSASPAEFDGPGDQWSPETLLVGAVADCLILTFRAVARAANLSWTSLECDVTGQLDRVDRVTQFTRFDIVAHLVVPPGEDAERARRALEKSERACLISSSLKAAMGLEARVTVGAPADSREATDCPAL